MDKVQLEVDMTHFRYYTNTTQNARRATMGGVSYTGL